MATSAATMSGGRATIPDDDLDTLRARLRGAAVDPEGAADTVRRPFNAMHQAEAALTVECSGTADVIDAVSFARERGLAIAVRGGGHSIAGLSTIDGGVLVDLAPMRGVQVEPEARIARVQGGALWADVDRETQAFGLATPGGVVSDTGVAGLTLGGGYGWLRRAFGLSCDNLLEAQVVCADGSVRRAAEDGDADLLWALRGGGGNLGVVTSFTFRLHEVGPIVPFAGTFYPIEDAAEVMRGWRDFVLTAPDEITATCVTITFPAAPGFPEAVHDRPVIIVAAVHAGTSPEAMAELQPLRELATPLVDISQPMPFAAIQAAFDPFFPRNTLRAYWKSQYLDELSDAAIDAVAAAAAERPAPMTLVNTFHMGGAISRVAPEATAFAERSSPFLVSVDGMWDDPSQDAALIDWVRSVWHDVGRFGTGAVYLNFFVDDDAPAEVGVRSALGPNVARLAEMKQAYDPGNFFRRNDNVAPAG